jgi:uncharacterized protein YukE
MRADVYSAFQVINQKLDTIIKLLRQDAEKETQMAVDLGSIREQVTRIHDLDESTKALLEGLAAKIDLLSAQDTVDPADLAALADALRNDSDALAAAVSANTR